MIALSRLRTDRRTQNYAKKRSAEGKSDRETMRCLKRYIAREMFRLLVPNPAVEAA
jgi:transposase